MIVSHQCRKCPTVITYEQGHHPRLFCEPCAKARIKASKAKSLKAIRERFGRDHSSIRQWEKRI